jgi:hypothetical protein
MVSTQPLEEAVVLFLLLPPPPPPPPPVTTLSLFIYDCMNSYSIWKCNILKFMLKSSLNFSYIATFQKGIVHEHLFQCILTHCILTQVMQV